METNTVCMYVCVYACNIPLHLVSVLALDWNQTYLLREIGTRKNPPLFFDAFSCT